MSALVFHATRGSLAESIRARGLAPWSDVSAHREVAVGLANHFARAHDEPFGLVAAVELHPGDLCGGHCPVIPRAVSARRVRGLELVPYDEDASEQALRFSRRYRGRPLRPVDSDAALAAWNEEATRSAAQGTPWEPIHGWPRKLAPAIEVAA